MVNVMPNRVSKQEQDLAPEPPETIPEPAEASFDPKSSAVNGSSSSEGIPRWRKIEIMQERAALREALGDDEMDLDALEDEVFGTDEENESFYVHDSTDVEEEEDLAEDEFKDDDFEDFDED